MTSTFLSFQTAATGANWTALGGSTDAERFNTLNVINATGTTLEFRRAGAGVGFQLPDGMAWAFSLVHLANLEVRRVDQANTQVTFYGEASE